ncbi:MAG TPA: hypothetical protein VMF52_11305 [Steroidobacteraceae bacterium]|nr:hypothetical protein [Steroidobacteraceae bacterium]
MARVAPPGDRATVNDVSEGLEVAIPARRNWFLILFLAFWLCGWFAGESSAIVQLAGDETRGDRAFLLFWLCGWTVGGVVVIAIWLWNVAGVERVTFTPSEIRVRRGVGGLGYSKEYDLAHASSLRVSPPVMNFLTPRSSMRFWGVGGGLMVFDYGSTTVRFGGGLDEPEARRIIDQVTARFPALRSVV